MSRHVADYETRLRESKTFRTTDAEDARPHNVYRIYDERDHLLYVGCAFDVESRISLHLALSTQSAASRRIQRHGAYYTTEWHATKAQARKAERAAIRDEAPALNKQHNPNFNTDLFERLGTLPGRTNPFAGLELKAAS